MKETHNTVAKTPWEKDKHTDMKDKIFQDWLIIQSIKEEKPDGYDTMPHRHKYQLHNIPHEQWNFKRGHVIGYNCMINTPTDGYHIKN